MKNCIMDEDWALCPDEIPKRVVRAAKQALDRDTILLAEINHPSRGYCYRCHTEVKAGPERRYKFRPGGDECPSCGQRVFVCYDISDATWGSQFVINLGTVQRGLDGRTVFVREWHLLRPKPGAGYSDDLLREVARYAIRDKSSAQWRHEHRGRFFQCTYYDPLGRWERSKKKVEGIYDDAFEMVLPTRRSMKAITRGTSLQYMDIHEYVDYVTENSSLARNEVRFMKDFASKRAYELLWKAGYKRVCLNNQGRYAYAGKSSDGVRWSADSVTGALQLPRWVLKLIPPERWTCECLHNARLAIPLYEAGKISRAAMPACITADAGFDLVKIGEICKKAPRLTIDRALVYISKQGRTVCEYRDYLEEARKLKLDLRDKEVLFPKDLRQAHARTTSLVKYRADKENEQLFNKQLKRLSALEAHIGDLLIRPAASAQELIYEGSYLHHCVGGYASRVAHGETAIFFIRKEAEPEVPYYTLEFRNGKVIQCRTLHNRSYEMEPEIKGFVDAWLGHVEKARVAV